jgi:hypothetical protein
MLPDTVYSDSLEVNKLLETIKREDLVERQRTLAKLCFCRTPAREIEDDINAAKPLLADRNSVRSHILRVVRKDELGRRFRGWSEKRESLREIWREMCRTPG